MRVFLAGAGGAIGKQLIPRLAADGHEVTGMVRTGSKRDLVSGLGARVVVADALDAAAVNRVLGEAKPEVVLHQLTSLPGNLEPRHFDRDFAATNRLRTEGTDNLLAAARAVGARRLVAQSYAGWPYARNGGTVKSEDDPLDPDPPEQFRRTLEAIRHLEAVVTGAEGIEGMVLRYGAFYGPGTSIAPEGEQVEAVRKRRFPVVGSGGGVWSFVQIEDAAAATAAAVSAGSPGTYNIVDDDPAPVSEWLPALAAAVEAKPPRKVPRWLGRLLAGEGAAMLMTESRGASNAKAKRELAWELRYSSWRSGFEQGLG
jgi:nucleoside-diphosphate-sugar epimerase